MNYNISSYIGSYIGELQNLNYEISNPRTIKFPENTSPLNIFYVNDNADIQNIIKQINENNNQFMDYCKNSLILAKESLSNNSNNKEYISLLYVDDNGKLSLLTSSKFNDINNITYKTLNTLFNDNELHDIKERIIQNVSEYMINQLRNDYQ